MKKYRNLIFYISIIGIFSILIYLTLHYGQINFSSEHNTKDLVSEASGWASFLKNLLHNIASPLAILLLQIVVILLAVRIFGWICKKIGQPAVVGEIIAGVTLGPSLLGLYFPDVYQFIFPASSLGNIGFLSQIGLILFMFIVGLELDLKTLKQRANTAVIISHSSIVLPFSFGVLIAYLLHDEFSLASTEFIPFALFMGIAMSIAAFPVMARIIHERGINKTPIGQVIITCAAIDDITAWCLLATVIAIVKAGSFTSSIFTILMAIGYIIIMFKVIRPFLKRLADFQSSRRTMTKSVIAIFFLILFLSSYATEIIGIHALFGAFLAGVIMPTNMNFRNILTEKIEDIALILLLPLFFVYTGIKTEIGLLNEPRLWLICGGIILLAVVGKSMGSGLAARFIGNSWKDSLTIGALMNTRGLMELVVLNIGLELGILTPEVFAMMVVMALTTTFMTSPLLNLIDRVFKKKQDTETAEQKKFKIIASFKDPEMGRKLVYIANCFIRKKQSNSELTMLHLTEGNVLYQYGMEEEEKQVFKPAVEASHSYSQPFTPMFKITNEVYANIAKTANKGDFDFLLMGYGGSIFDGNVLWRMLGFSNKLIYMPNYLLSLLGVHKKWSKTMNFDLDENVRTIISKSDVPIGMFIDKGLVEIRNVFIPILDEEDIFVAQFMKRLAENSNVRITLWDATGLIEQSIDFVNAVKAIKAVNPYLFQLWNNNIPIDSDILKKHDLVMISLNSWKKIENIGSKWAKDIPSTLVLIDN